MATVDKLGGSLQENLLTLVCWDDSSFQLVRNSVPVDLFTTDVFRDIVGSAYDFIDKHKKPPKDHLPDLVEKQINGKDGDLYRQVIQAVRTVKETLNSEYILKQLDKFIQTQEFKLGVIESSELLNQGKVEEAQEAMEKRLKSRLTLFSSGMRLEEALANLAARGTFREALPLGIPELDAHHLGPARKELHALLGPKKGGKSWWLQLITKMGLIMGERVAVVTLELGEELYNIRIIQSLYSLTLNNAETIWVRRFKKDSKGQVTEIEKEKLIRKSLLTPQGRKEAKKGLDKFSQNLRVRQFPTSELTVTQLKAHLDAMETMENFIPDTLIVDYPKLMHHDPGNLRIELGSTLEKLRGIGVDRNMRVCVVGQVNRESVERSLTKGTSAAEDFSINHTADIVLTYSQTPAEYQLGLARLGVDASRISKQHINLMISQNYECGQFYFDSAPLMSNWKEEVKRLTGREDLGEEM